MQDRREGGWVLFEISAGARGGGVLFEIGTEGGLLFEIGAKGATV